MNLLFIILFSLFGKSISPSPDPPGKEVFVNEVINEISDSSFSSYYLLSEAAPCSFKRYQYDEWEKYGLKEDIPFFVLNELSEQCYHNASMEEWNDSKLNHAICVTDSQAKKILDPFYDDDGMHLSRKKTRHIIKSWSAKPFNERMVFSFSRPAFTKDNEYAVMDVAFKCDSHGCGEGATYIFKNTGTRWEIAGKLLSWKN
ncbi:MAG: hypothetical protein C5B59_15750 [Bacteroidetes bacterium]|nr:MAG: hypothetical protein C5B59_15750 [Bacteroidota bacterium]